MRRVLPLWFPNVFFSDWFVNRSRCLHKFIRELTKRAVPRVPRRQLFFSAWRIIITVMCWGRFGIVGFQDSQVRFDSECRKVPNWNFATSDIKETWTIWNQLLARSSLFENWQNVWDLIVTLNLSTNSHRVSKAVGYLIAFDSYHFVLIGVFFFLFHFFLPCITLLYFALLLNFSLFETEWIYVYFFFILSESGCTQFRQWINICLPELIWRWRRHH